MSDNPTKEIIADTMTNVACWRKEAKRFGVGTRGLLGK
jgi:hypothetical protein